MRLVHGFEHTGQPHQWPDDWRERTHLVEDGDDTVLHVDYEDKTFRRPMEPTNPDDLRAEYGKGESRS